MLLCGIYLLSVKIKARFSSLTNSQAGIKGGLVKRGDLLNN